MRSFSALMLTLVLAAPVMANPGGSPSQPPPTTPSTVERRDQPLGGPRHEAEQSYALAYEEVAKAKKDLESGKTKNAEKKFRRAMERAERSTALDAKYHEAWNLVGYCARKLGDYPKAFAAYEKCLDVKPDYAPAREYLGEAYLERGEPKKAREQLLLLERLGEAEEEASRLFAAIQAYEKAHPETGAAPGAAAPASADSSGSSR